VATTTDLYFQGKLREAIDAQIGAVKAKPADQSLRLFLFELFSFAGEFDRAHKQLDVLKFEEPELLAAAVNYRNCLESEALRTKTFQNSVEPGYLKPPPDHVKLRFEALVKLQSGDSAGAKAALEKAEEATPEYKGSLNDKPFEYLRDSDDILGPVLEIFAKGKYYWLPYEEIELLASVPPKVPRDIIWRAANLQVRDGAAGEIFMPAIYFGSWQHADDAVKLGRKNDFIENPNGPGRAVGMRVLLTESDDIPFAKLENLTAAESA
jgi:type VI secretion system protein ImpE